MDTTQSCHGKHLNRLLKGKIVVVAEDVEMIIADAFWTGLQLNSSKCKIIASNFEKVKNFSIVKDFKRVQKEDQTILGPPVLKGSPIDKALEEKIAELERAYCKL